MNTVEEKLIPILDKHAAVLMGMHQALSDLQLRVDRDLVKYGKALDAISSTPQAKIASVGNEQALVQDLAAVKERIEADKTEWTKHFSNLARSIAEANEEFERVRLRYQALDVFRSRTSETLNEQRNTLGELTQYATTQTQHLESMWTRLSELKDAAESAMLAEKNARAKELEAIRLEIAANNAKGENAIKSLRRWIMVLAVALFSLGCLAYLR